MAKIGDVVHKVPSFLFCESDHSRNVVRRGIVRWVHPKGRFYLVEFPTPGGAVRECFPAETAPNVGALTEEKERRTWHKGI